MRLLMIVVLVALTGACRPTVVQSSLSESEVPSGEELPLNDLIAAAHDATIAAGVAEVQAGAHIVQCATSANLSQNVEFVTNTFKGLIVDGLGGDLCMVKDGIYYCGKESLRAAMSLDPLGRWILRQRGARTTEEVVAQGAVAAYEYSTQAAAFISEHGEDMAKYIYRLHTDQSYQIEQAVKIYTLLAMAGTELMGEVSNTSCDVLRGQFARILGMISYEITLTIGLAVITAEVGGAGGGAKLGSLLAKLTRIASSDSRIGNLVRKIVAGLRRVADKIMDFRYGSKADDAVDAGVDAGRILENADDARDVVRVARIVDCVADAASGIGLTAFGLTADVCKIVYVGNAESRIARVTKKNNVVKAAYDKVLELLRSGQKGPNEHWLKAEYKGMLGIDIENGQRGRGGLRLIISRKNGEVAIHDLVDYH